MCLLINSLRPYLSLIIFCNKGKFSFFFFFIFVLFFIVILHITFPILLPLFSLFFQPLFFSALSRCFYVRLYPVLSLTSFFIYLYFLFLYLHFTFLHLSSIPLHLYIILLHLYFTFLHLYFHPSSYHPSSSVFPLLPSLFRPSSPSPFSFVLRIFPSLSYYHILNMLSILNGSSVLVYRGAISITYELEYPW